jgi:hypothetical protein
MGRKNSSKKHSAPSTPSTASIPSASQSQSQPSSPSHLDVEIPLSPSVLKAASQNISPNPFSAKTIPLPKTYSKVITEPPPPIFAIPESTPSTPVQKSYNDLFPSLPPIRKQTLNPPPGFPKKINEYVLFPQKATYFEEYQQQQLQQQQLQQLQQELYKQQQQQEFRMRQQILQQQHQQQIRHSQELQAQQMYYQQMRATTPLSIQNMHSYENFWSGMPGYSHAMYCEQSRQSYNYFPK